MSPSELTWEEFTAGQTEMMSEIHGCKQFGKVMFHM